MTKTEFQLINEQPPTWNVYIEKAAIGKIIQLSENSFHAKGTYFEVTVSNLEYAKSCFERTELQKAVTKNNQILIPNL